jgi:hypothetical protein
MEMEQTYLIEFFMDEGVKAVEIIDRLKKHYFWDALRRA